MSSATDDAITAEDAAGPIVPDVPADLMAQAALPALSYTSVRSNPALFREADPSRARAKMSVGPRVGCTESHGCTRLTNRDAMRVADLVAPGTKVVLR